MAPRGDVLGAEGAGLNVFAEKIFVGIRGHVSVGSQIPSLGTEQDFFATDALSCELLERLADAALAALKSVVDRGVDHIGAVFHSCGRRHRVTCICLFVWLAEIRADPDGREREPLRFSKMAIGRASRELLLVPRRSFFGGGSAHDGPCAD